MNRPFGHTVKISFSLSRTWLSLGPGWAALAGAVAGGIVDFELALILQLVALWLLVDPLLGTLWELSVGQGLWRHVTRAQLPASPARGFSLPYARPHTPGGDFVLLVRRYRLWWRRAYWPEFGGQVVTFGMGLVVALLLGLLFNTTVFWLVVLAVGLILLAGLRPSNLASRGGGRLQSLVQFLLPWLMGAFIWPPAGTAVLLAGGCYWTVYLGGLRMLGGHHRAELLFFLGQTAVIFILLALQLLPGAAILSVLLLAQWLTKTQYSHAAEFLPKVQLYLVAGLLAAGLSLGTLL